MDNPMKLWRCAELDIAPFKARLQEDLEHTGLSLGREACGIELAVALAKRRDRLLIDVMDALEQVQVPVPPVRIYATGSYGQRLVCPRSDVDLLVVYEPALVPAQALGRWGGAFQTALRDIGFKVGMAARTPAQCLEMATDDVSIGASMLDARLIWGQDAAHDSLRQRVAGALRSADGGRSFAQAVRQGCRMRHARYGRTIFLLEPEVKHGRGGLRDLQALQWSARVLHGAWDLMGIAKVAGAGEGQRQGLERAVSHLLLVRIALHLAGGRFGNDRLTFPFQESLAKRLGDASAQADAVGYFMRDFYEAANTLAGCSLGWQDIWLLPPDDDHPVEIGPGICVRQGRVDLLRKDDRPEVAQPIPAPEVAQPTAAEGDDIAIGPMLGSISTAALERLKDNPLAPFEAALDLELPLHPVLEAHLPRLPAFLKQHPVHDEAMRSLRRILCSQQEGGDALSRALSRSRVLPWLMPDFEPIVALGQHDVYHVYTVDAHLVRALERGRALLRGQWSQEGRPGAGRFTALAQAMPSHRRDVWLLSCLLHDVGKGRKEDHSLVGAQIATRLGPRLGLTRSQSDHLSFLIREHLLMPRISQRRDLNDPENILHVARIVRTRAALTDLTLLTAVDIDAVGPQNLTPWKARLLLELHDRVREVLKGGLSALERSTGRGELRRALLGALEAGTGQSLSAQEHAALERFCDGMPAAYLSASNTEELARHARTFVKPEPVAVDFHDLPDASLAELVVCVDGRPRSLAIIAGVLAAGGMNILTAQINTEARSRRTLDVLVVQDATGRVLSNAHRRAALAAQLRAALEGQTQVETLLADRRSGGVGRRPAPEVALEVRVDPAISKSYTIVEVKAHDHVGLLWTVARCLFDVGCEVHVAKIITEGVRVIDTFYLLWRASGQKLTEAQSQAVRLALEETLQAAEPC